MGKLYLGTQEITPLVYDEKEFIGLPREVTDNGVYSLPQSGFRFKVPDGVTAIGRMALNVAFQSQPITEFDADSVTSIDYSGMSNACMGCTTLVSVKLNLLHSIGQDGCTNAFRMTKITNISLPSLTSVSSGALQNAFFGCDSLVSADLSSLASVGAQSALQYCFAGYCTSLTSVDLSSLATVSGASALRYCFTNCTALPTLNLSSLATVSGGYGLANLCSGCTSLASVRLDSLSTLTGTQAMFGAFTNCASLTTLSFPALTTSSFGSYTNQFNNMLQGCSNVTVHFPAAIQSTIGSWLDVQNGFGGTNTTVSFDL